MSLLSVSYRLGTSGSEEIRGAHAVANLADQASSLLRAEFRSTAAESTSRGSHQGLRGAAARQHSANIYDPHGKWTRISSSETLVKNPHENGGVLDLLGHAKTQLATGDPQPSLGARLIFGERTAQGYASRAAAKLETIANEARDFAAAAERRAAIDAGARRARA